MAAKCFLQKTLCGLTRNFKRNLPYNTQVKVLCFTLQYAESHYFTEGNEYKITFLHPWVWDYEVRSVERFVPVEKNVDVDGAGGIDSPAFGIILRR